MAKIMFLFLKFLLNAPPRYQRSLEIFHRQGSPKIRSHAESIEGMPGISGEISRNPQRDPPRDLAGDPKKTEI
jgi:hypothetical protein